MRAGSRAPALSQHRSSRSCGTRSPIQARPCSCMGSHTVSQPSACCLWVLAGLPAKRPYQASWRQSEGSQSGLQPSFAIPHGIADRSSLAASHPHMRLLRRDSACCPGVAAASPPLRQASWHRRLLRLIRACFFVTAPAVQVSRQRHRPCTAPRGLGAGSVVLSCAPASSRQRGLGACSVVLSCAPASSW